MKEKLSPKVEALYKAVMELLLEGREIRKMKVSEITERAGIGKGTAYEYFESREKLLVDAVDYFQRTWAESIWEELSHYSGFMEKISYLFDLLDQVMKKIRREAMVEICSIFFFSPIFKEDKGDMTERLYGIVREGKRGGILREEFPDEYIVLALAGKIFDYISYCVSVKENNRKVCTPVQVKAYLLNSIRREFVKGQELLPGYGKSVR